MNEAEQAHAKVLNNLIDAMRPVAFAAMQGSVTAVPYRLIGSILTRMDAAEALVAAEVGDECYVPWASADDLTAEQLEAVGEYRKATDAYIEGLRDESARAQDLMDAENYAPGAEIEVPWSLLATVIRRMDAAEKALDRP